MGGGGRQQAFGPDFTDAKTSAEMIKRRDAFFSTQPDKATRDSFLNAYNGTYGPDRMSYKGPAPIVEESYGQGSMGLQNKVGFFQRVSDAEKFANSAIDLTSQREASDAEKERIQTATAAAADQNQALQRKRALQGSGNVSGNITGRGNGSSPTLLTNPLGVVANSKSILGL